MSKWVKISETASDDDRPRKLTSEEINEILESVPKIAFTTKDCGELCRVQNQAKLLYMLKDEELAPSQIAALKEKNKRRFYNALVAPGSFVGVWAAGIIGQNSTQTVLNTFHLAGGASNVSASVNMLLSLVQTSQKLRYESVNIHFKDKTLSFIDVLRKRMEIVSITLRDLVDGLPDIKKDMPKMWWSDIACIMTRIYVEGYTDSKTLSRDNAKATYSKPSYSMRIRLKRNMLFQYRIDMQKIAEALESYFGVFVLCSPTSEGIIDIFPDEVRIVEALSKSGFEAVEDPSLLYISRIVYPELSKVIIQGIPGIVNAIPIVLEVMDAVKNEKPLQPAKEDSPREFKVSFNTIKVRTTGIGFKEFTRLLDTVKYKWRLPPDASKDSEINAVIVESPNANSPTQNIKEMVAKEERNESNKFFQYRLKSEEERGEYIDPPLSSPLLRAAKVTILTTKGTALKKIVSRDDVDAAHTYSRNIHEMTEVFGVHAARNSYIKELHGMLGSGINMRHMELLAYFTFTSGKPYGITYASLTRQPIGPLSLATSKESATIFSRAALFGTRDPFFDTSARLYIGQKINGGTGNIEIIEADTEFRRAMQAEGAEGTITGDDTADFTNVLFEADTLDKALGEAERQKEEIQPNEEAVVRMSLPSSLNLPPLDIKETFVMKPIEEKFVEFNVEEEEE